MVKFLASHSKMHIEEKLGVIKDQPFLSVVSVEGASDGKLEYWSEDLE